MTCTRLALAAILSLGALPVATPAPAEPEPVQEEPVKDSFLDTFKPVNVAAEKDELGKVVDKVAEGVEALPVSAPAVAEPEPVQEPVQEEPVKASAPAGFRRVSDPAVAEPVQEPVQEEPVEVDPLAAFRPVETSESPVEEAEMPSSVSEESTLQDALLNRPGNRTQDIPGFGEPNEDDRSLGRKAMDAVNNLAARKDAARASRDRLLNQRLATCEDAVRSSRDGLLNQRLTATQAGDYVTAQDYLETVKSDLLAAGQCDAGALYRLGVMYKFGKGVTKDYSEAVKWWRLSADQGYAKAQNALGNENQIGRAALQDYVEAGKWYQLAASQGLAVAQVSLGLMHKQGKGFPQNNVMAHMWFNIASAEGNNIAGELRDETARQMTSEDISKAQATARECMSSDYTKCGY